MGKKPLLILAGIIIAAGVGFLFLRNSTLQSPSEEVFRETQAQTYTSPEYRFSIVIPEGWSYNDTPQEVLDSILVVEFISSDGRIRVPIFVEEQDWEEVRMKVAQNFKPETITETMLAGQPAIKILNQPQEKERTPSYTYRIKHPNRNLVLGGAVALIRGREGEVDSFRQTVEAVLNSLTFF